MRMRLFGPFVSLIVIVALIETSCDRPPATDGWHGKGEQMKQPAVKFTVQDEQLLRKLGIVVFRDKIILDARPPITAAQLAEIEKKVDGKVPPALLALWNVSFGGQLDYDFEVQFGDHIYSSSFRELFYPGSDHYHDLHGWIDHELELAQEVAAERGKAIPDRTPFIPIGGFEYLERFYVSLKPNEYGSVLVYAQGIPWKGRLNEDSIASVARSVSELFDQLVLNEDPFDEESGEYARGKDIVERIIQIESEHPELAKRLKEVVRSSIMNWQRIVDQTDFSTSTSAEESKALRLALQFAADRNNVDLVERLHAKGAPFNVTLSGTGGVLYVAMAQKSFAVVERLIDLDADLGDAPVLFASHCPDKLLLKLINRGVTFDEEAIYSAAETGAISGAIALAQSSQVIEPKPSAQIAAIAMQRASKHDESAAQVEAGKLGSYLTPQQYRTQATLLRQFAEGLKAGK